MNPARDTARFSAIAAKVRANEPLALEDGVFLYGYPDLLALGSEKKQSPATPRSTLVQTPRTSPHREKAVAEFNPEAVNRALPPVPGFRAAPTTFGTSAGYPL